MKFQSLEWEMYFDFLELLEEEEQDLAFELALEAHIRYSE